MSNKENGGPAFPLDYETTTAIHGTSFADAAQGMTLRDYFAAKAMQSFMSWALDQEPFDGYETAADCCKAYAKHSYSIADAMLEARK